MRGSGEIILIEPFNGDQVVADAIAAKHLDIRLQQRADGENEFNTDINSSQADLKGMQDNYVNPGGNFWIATEASTGAIAGFVGLKKEASELKLKRMAVMPEYRGNHIGLRLARTLITWAVDQDFETIALTTGKDELARPLIYEPLGFVVVGFDDVHQDHLMELKLK